MLERQPIPRSAERASLKVEPGISRLNRNPRSDPKVISPPSPSTTDTTPAPEYTRPPPRAAPPEPALPAASVECRTTTPAAPAYPIYARARHPDSHSRRALA